MLKANVVSAVPLETYLEATSCFQKEREDSTIWAYSQNPLKHNTQHMALRHIERLSKYLTPIPAYVTDTPVR